MDSSDGFTDEILIADKTDLAKLSRSDRIFTILEGFLESDEFFAWQDDFAGIHCGLFTVEGDLPPQCMNIFQEYVKSVETKLLAKVRKAQPDFNFEALVPILTSHKHDDSFQFAHVFEVLNAALDFDEFRALMASYRSGQGLPFDVTTTKLELEYIFRLGDVN
jgi:hypothetical protein